MGGQKKKPALVARAEAKQHPTTHILRQDGHSVKIIHMDSVYEETDGEWERWFVADHPLHDYAAAPSDETVISVAGASVICATFARVLDAFDVVEQVAETILSQLSDALDNLPDAEIVKAIGGKI